MGKHLNGKKLMLECYKGSILGLLFFLININDFSDGISSLVKLFADDISIFSVVQNKNDSALQLKNDLDKVSE